MEPSPNVVISTLGKFFLFGMAEALARQGRLHRLVTDQYSGALPWLRRFRVDSERIPPERCRVAPWMQVFRALRYLPEGSGRHRLEVAQCMAFDAWASRQIEGADVAVVRSQVAEATLRRARRQGAVGVLFRASTHIAEQFDRLEEEFRRFGLTCSLNRYLRDRELREYESADKLLVVSHQVADTFKERGYPADRLIVSQPGVLREVFHPGRERRRHGVLFVGAVGLRKGVPYLAQAVGRLRLKAEDTCLLGVMEPSGEAVLRRLGIPLRHHPPVPHQQVRDFYRSSEVMVLPSIEEGLAGVVLESLACGCPVVATRESGAADVVRNGWNGYIVPARDPEALADAVDRVLSLSPGRAAAMRRAAAASVRGFTVARFAERFIEAL